MAQVTGGSDFDGEWEERTNVCLGLLREAADRIASDGVDTLRAHVIVDAFVWALATPLPPVMFQPGKPRLPPRFSRAMHQRNLPLHIRAAAYARAAQSLRTRRPLLYSLASSRRQRGSGQTVIPKNRVRLRELLGVLWSKDLARHPPSKAYPRGI